MRSMHLVILTPFGKFFDGKAESLTLLTADGELGILAGRERASIAVEKGVIRLSSGGETLHLSEDGGIFEIDGDEAVLLFPAVYEESVANEERAKRAVALEKERERQKRSLTEHNLGKAALAKAFDKLKSAKHNAE